MAEKSSTWCAVYGAIVAARTQALVAGGADPLSGDALRRVVVDARYLATRAEEALADLVEEQRRNRLRAEAEDTADEMPWSPAPKGA